MSDLVVITFPDETSGPAALQHMRDAQKNAGLALKDVAAVVKDADGKVKTHNETDSTTAHRRDRRWLPRPAPGPRVLPHRRPRHRRHRRRAHRQEPRPQRGRSARPGRDRTTSDPARSAVFVLVEGNAGALVGSVRHLGGKVYQTTLDPDLEQQLNESLKTQG